MVFMVSRGVKSELWPLENFLPVSSAASLPTARGH
jgi:hypothetical protein